MVQGIIGLHESGLTDEEKAIASKMYYKKGKTARKSPVKVYKTRAVASEVDDEPETGAGAGGNARGIVRRNAAEVASRQGRAEPSQPWGAQSPTGVKVDQVSRQGKAQGSAAQFSLQLLD